MEKALSPQARRDTEVIDGLNELVKDHPRWGFWKYVDRCKALRQLRNHKRLYRVYCALGLNQLRRTKRWLPKREGVPHQVRSADFMSDALYHGVRFRAFTLIDEYNREGLTIEIDTLLRASRLIRVFERLKAERGLPDVLRLDNCPDFPAYEFIQWMTDQGAFIKYIQPGKPNQNAFFERFNRTYRNEELNLYLSRHLDQVREITAEWLIEYNELRPHDALGGLPPSLYTNENAEHSTLELST